MFILSKAGIARAESIASAKNRNQSNGIGTPALRYVAAAAVQLLASTECLTWSGKVQAQDCSSLPNQLVSPITSQDAQEGAVDETPISSSITEPDFTPPLVNTPAVYHSDAGDYNDGGGAPGTISGTDYDGTDAGGATMSWAGQDVGGEITLAPNSTFNYVSDPIDLRSGDKSHVQVDYLSRGAAALRLARVYHSNPAVNVARITVPMGSGWHMFYDRSLQVLSGTQVRLHRANGRTLDFSFNGSVWASSLPAGSLTQVAGGWIYVNARDTIETYDTTGRLVQLADGGLSTSLSYDGNGRLARIANQFGRAISLLYDAIGRVGSVMLPDGNALAYTYGASNREGYLPPL